MRRKKQKSNNSSSKNKQSIVKKQKIQVFWSNIKQFLKWRGRTTTNRLSETIKKDQVIVKPVVYKTENDKTTMKLVPRLEESKRATGLVVKYFSTCETDSEPNSNNQRHHNQNNHQHHHHLDRSNSEIPWSHAYL